MSLRQGVGGEQKIPSSELLYKKLILDHMFHNAHTNIIDMHLILIIKLILHNLIVYPLDQVDSISEPSTT